MRNFQRPYLSTLLKTVAFLFDEATTRRVSRLEIMRAIGRVGPETDRLTQADLQLFKRLKQDIRELGIPLESPVWKRKKGNTGAYEEEEGASEYWISQRHYALRGLNLDRTDEILLALIGNHIGQDAGFPLRTNLGIALQKISQVADPTNLSEEFTDCIFPSPEEIPAQQDSRILDKLILANTCHQTVCFEYQGIQSDYPMNREVEPYGLFTRRQNWYLVGRDVSKDDVRVFRVNRIDASKGVKVQPGRTFTIPEDFRLRDYSSVPPWNYFSDNQAREVVIEISKDDFWKMEKFCRRHGSVEEVESESSVRWHPKVKEFDPLIKWILPYGTAVRPVAPPEFKTRYQEVVMETLKRYLEPND